jgi:hypothetical protein
VDVATELPELNDARFIVNIPPSSNHKNPFARGSKRQRENNNFSNNFKKSKWQR